MRQVSTFKDQIGHTYFEFVFHLISFCFSFFYYTLISIHLLQIQEKMFFSKIKNKL